MKIYQIWTDGSCDNNPKNLKSGFGGWAFVVEINDKVIFEDLGFDLSTSSNRMELTAAMKAMKWAIEKKPRNKFVIHSDSAYLVNCFKERWYLRWREMKWDNVKNSDLWMEILELYESKSIRVRFNKVKGHSGIKNNERADFLAGTARKYAMEI